MKLLLEHMSWAGEELDRKFVEASALGLGTPQEVAEWRENALRDVLGRYFPFPHRLTKGKIFDANGLASASIDCVLLNPEHPFTTDRHGKYSFLLADGVDCAIELKPNLATSDELSRALTQARSVKRLLRHKAGVLRIRKSEEEYQARKEQALRITFAIFTSKINNLEEFVGRVEAYHREHVVQPSEQFDIVVVNGVGLLTNKKISFSNPTLPEEALPGSSGFVWEEFGTATLAAFILRINSLDLAIPRIAEPVVARYLRDLAPNQVRVFPRQFVA